MVYQNIIIAIVVIGVGLIIGMVVGGIRQRRKVATKKSKVAPDEFKGLKVVKWISVSDLKPTMEYTGIGALGGFFKEGMRWKDYKVRYIPEVYEALENLRASIIKNHIRYTGEQHQQNGVNAVPLWNNGKVDLFSYRAWGDLMAAVWSSEDNKDYHYMNFYM